MPYGVISVPSGIYHIQVGNPSLIRKLPFSFSFLTGYRGCFIGMTEDDQTYYLRCPGYVIDDSTDPLSDLPEMPDVCDILIPAGSYNFKVLSLSGQSISKIALGRECLYFLKEGDVYRTRLSRTGKTVTMKIHSPRDVRIVDVQTTYPDIFHPKSPAYFLSLTGQVLVESGLHMKLLPFPNEIKEVACGREHALFLDYDGNIYGLGKSDRGQLGTEIFRRYECTLTEALIKGRRKGRRGEAQVKIPIGNLEARSIYTKEDTSYFLTHDGGFYVIGIVDVDDREIRGINRVQGVEIVDEVFTGYDVVFLVSGEEVYSLLDRSISCRLVEGLNVGQLRNKAKSSYRN